MSDRLLQYHRDRHAACLRALASRVERGVAVLTEIDERHAHRVFGEHGEKLVWTGTSLNVEAVFGGDHE